MRQFILAQNLVTSGEVGASTEYGKVGFAYLDKADNKMKFTATGAEILPDGEGYIVLVRKNEEQGNVVLPIHKNHFSYVYGKYDESKYADYQNSFTVPDVEAFLDYTVIVVLKGKKFNERNKWTATAEAVVMKAYGSAAYVADLADKAAADAGFEYTYDEGVNFYPGYPLNPLAQPLAEDTGFDIFTIRCAEPRDVKTRDEVVHQIVQVAFPHGVGAAFEDICKKLAGIEDESEDVQEH